jgi:hypothetical protein
LRNGGDGHTAASIEVLQNTAGMATELWLHDVPFGLGDVMELAPRAIRAMPRSILDISHSIDILVVPILIDGASIPAP